MAATVVIVMGVRGGRGGSTSLFFLLCYLPSSPGDSDRLAVVDRLHGELTGHELLHELMYTRTALRHLDQLFLILVIRCTVLTQQQTNLTAATNAQDHFQAPDDHDFIIRYTRSSLESSAVAHHTCAV